MSATTQDSIGIAPAQIQQTPPNDTATGMCWKCKQKREFTVGNVTPASNGKTQIAVGKCLTCNGNVSVIRKIVGSAIPTTH